MFESTDVPLNSSLTEGANGRTLFECHPPTGVGSAARAAGEMADARNNAVRTPTNRIGDMLHSLSVSGKQWMVESESLK